MKHRAPGRAKARAARQFAEFARRSAERTARWASGEGIAGRARWRIWRRERHRQQKEQA